MNTADRLDCNPLISVIIPIYNKSRYLNTLLSQVQAQTFVNFECLLIDDGSSDCSGEICNQYAELDERFGVIHIPNGGVSHARNIGIDHAKGKYITFIDADDEITDDYLENLYDAITKTGAELVISGLVKFNEQGIINTVCHPEAPKFVKKEQLLKQFADVQNQGGIYGYCVAKLFRAELSKSVRFDEVIRLAEDFDFYLRLYPRVKSIYLDNKPLYRYRQEAENSSVLVRDDQIDYVSQLNINLRYRDFLVKENAFDGNNRKIVEEKIQNYLYFSLFHCPLNQVDERFQLLWNICEEQHVVPHGERGMQKLLLQFLRKKQLSGVKAMLWTYRTARNFRNKLKIR